MNTLQQLIEKWEQEAADIKSRMNNPNMEISMWGMMNARWQQLLDCTHEARLLLKEETAKDLPECICHLGGIAPSKCAAH